MTSSRHKAPRHVGSSLNLKQQRNTRFCLYVWVLAFQSNEFTSFLNLRHRRSFSNTFPENTTKIQETWKSVYTKKRGIRFETPRLVLNRFRAAVKKKFQWINSMKFGIWEYFFTELEPSLNSRLNLNFSHLISFFTRIF